MFVEEALPVLKVCNSVPELRTLDSWNFIFAGISTSKDVSVDIGDTLMCIPPHV